MDNNPGLSVIDKFKSLLKGTVVNTGISVVREKLFSSQGGIYRKNVLAIHKRLFQHTWTVSRQESITPSIGL